MAAKRGALEFTPSTWSHVKHLCQKSTLRQFLHTKRVAGHPAFRFISRSYIQTNDVPELLDIFGEYPQLWLEYMAPKSSSAFSDDMIIHTRPSLTGQGVHIRFEYK